MKKSIVLIPLLFILLSGYTLKAQINGTSTSVTGQTGVITTTVPFLLITPDARSGGMADAGVAITPDANSTYWNPSKLAFVQDNMGFSASYNPWLRELVPDINLYYISGYKKLDDVSAIGASVKYFSLGDIAFTNNNGNNIGNYRPQELSADLSYARKLTDHFSLGVTGRYIYSDLTGQFTLPNGTTISPAKDAAVDVSAYDVHQVHLGKLNADLAFGCNISNIGPKLSYISGYIGDFLPANLKLGGNLNLHINEENEISFSLDLNKLLVPTPPDYLLNYRGDDSIVNGQPVIIKGKNPNVSVIQGMIQSFGDAPGGASQQWAEIDPSFAFEYWHNRMFAIRAGYFYEALTEGNRQYLTFGIGGKYNGFALDLSYLFPTNAQSVLTRSPLENTIRFTLSYYIK